MQLCKWKRDGARQELAERKNEWASRRERDWLLSNLHSINRSWQMLNLKCLYNNNIIYYSNQLICGANTFYWSRAAVAARLFTFKQVNKFTSVLFDKQILLTFFIFAWILFKLSLSHCRKFLSCHFPLSTKENSQKMMQSTFLGNVLSYLICIRKLFAKILWYSMIYCEFIIYFFLYYNN